MILDSKQSEERETELMDLDPQRNEATPKLVLVCSPITDHIHIRCQALSIEKAHKVVPGTIAHNRGAACKNLRRVFYEIAHKMGGAR